MTYTYQSTAISSQQKLPATKADLYTQELRKIGPSLFNYITP